MQRGKIIIQEEQTVILYAESYTIYNTNDGRLLSRSNVLNFFLHKFICLWAGRM